MHLVYAIDSLISGGAQRQAVELAVRLCGERDLRVGFLVYREHDFFGGRLRGAGIPVARVPRRGRYDPGFPRRLRRWLRQSGADLVHAFLPWPSLWCTLAVRGMRPAERPRLIAAERSSLVATSLREAVLQRLVYRSSDAVTANAESVAEELHRKLGIARERIHYLPNGIDLDAWDRAARAEPPLALERDRFQLALIGGLRREKNHALVLAALARLPRERIARWRVWFIGDETGGRGDARRIRREIEERRLGDVVRIVPPTPRIAAVMARLDGVLLPSDFEGFPNAALEAMASRVAVIATPVGDVPNLIEDGVSGYLLPRLDAAALAEAMARLEVCGVAGRAALGERARARVADRFDMASVARRHLALYREIAGRERGAGA